MKIIATPQGIKVIGKPDDRPMQQNSPLVDVVAELMQERPNTVKNGEVFIQPKDAK